MALCELEVGAHAGTLVLRAVGELDDDAVASIGEVLRAARSTGAEPAVALDGVTRFAPRALAALSRHTFDIVPGDPAHPRSFLLPTSAGWWLVDEAERRLCRLDRPTHPLFVPEDAWVSYDRLEVRAGWVVAHTRSGSRIVSGLAAMP